MINTNVLETQHLLHKIKGLTTAYGTNSDLCLDKLFACRQLSVIQLLLVNIMNKLRGLVEYNAFQPYGRAQSISLKLLYFSVYNVHSKSKNNICSNNLVKLVSAIIQEGTLCISVMRGLRIVISYKKTSTHSGKKHPRNLLFLFQR